MNETATSIRLKAMQLDLAYSRLSQHSHLQAEAISRHYVAHATMAMNIMYLIKLRSPFRSNPELESVIESQIAIIKTNHANDLGVVLDWPEPDIS